MVVFFVKQKKILLRKSILFSLTEMSSKMRSLDRELRGVRMEKEDIERVRLLLLRKVLIEEWLLYHNELKKHVHCEQNKKGLALISLIQSIRFEGFIRERTTRMAF